MIVVSIFLGYFSETNPIDGKQGEGNAPEIPMKPKPPLSPSTPLVHHPKKSSETPTRQAAPNKFRRSQLKLDNLRASFADVERQTGSSSQVLGTQKPVRYKHGIMKGNASNTSERETIVLYDIS